MVNIGARAPQAVPALAGQQQRVRWHAPLCHVHVMLLDEPLSNLDANLRRNAFRD
jgi:ABC-type sugar transport system ATPase subunit